MSKSKALDEFIKNTYHYGVGVNDVHPTNRHEKAYVVWKSMLSRCYCEPLLNRHPTYRGCSVCEEWLLFSNFRKWFYERFVNRVGHDLDKDILVKGNKVYSPDTCCFVPHRINCLLQKNEALRSELPIGVYVDTWSKHGYISTIHINGKCETLGHFDTPEEAFQAYKRVKEAYIALEANIAYSKGQIEKRTLDALLNYKVEITD